MSNRKSIVSQTDVARMVRACRQLDVPIYAIEVGPNGIRVETAKKTDSSPPEDETPVVM
jgi:hypothetical protein